MQKYRLIPALFLIVGVLLCGCTDTSGQEPQSLIQVTEQPTPNPIEEIKPEQSPEDPPVSDKNSSEIADDANDEFSFAEKMAVIQERLDAEPPVEMKIGSTTDIYLMENPTTGYSWNVTVTDGLKITEDSYSPTSEIGVGGGGDHHWVIEATAPGNQTFSAIYHRPWEAPSPDDATYIERFIVIE